MGPLVPHPAALLDELVDAVGAEPLGLGRSPWPAPASWSRQTSAVMSWVPGASSGGIAPLVAAVGAEPVLRPVGRPAPPWSRSSRGRRAGRRRSGGPGRGRRGPSAGPRPAPARGRRRRRRWPPATSGGSAATTTSREPGVDEHLVPPPVTALPEVEREVVEQLVGEDDARGGEARAARRGSRRSVPGRSAAGPRAVVVLRAERERRRVERQVLGVPAPAAAPTARRARSAAPARTPARRRAPTGRACRARRRPRPPRTDRARPARRHHASSARPTTAPNSGPTSGEVRNAPPRRPADPPPPA